MRRPASADPRYVASVAGMASYIDSAAIVSNGTALVIYQEAIGITDGQFGLLSGLLTFGIAAGALLGGRLGDRFGRRRVFLATMALVVVGSGLNVLATGFVPLAVGVLLVGVATGADLPVSLATVAEAASAHERGALLGLSNILWTVGILAATSLGFLVGDMGRVGGQLLYAHVGAVALVVLVLRWPIPESPFWLQASRRSTVPARPRSSSPDETAPGALSRLLRPPYLAPMAVLLVFYALTNLAANTNGQFSTKIAVDTVGVSVDTAAGLSLLAFPFGVLGGIWFMRVVGTDRRMPWFVIGAVLLVIGYAVPAALGFTRTTFVVGLVLGVIGGCFAFEGILKVWTQESFPTLLRATAQGTIVAVARVLAGALAFVTPALLDRFGARGLYGLLAVLVAIGVVVAWRFFVHREVDEIADEESRLEPAVPA